MTAVATARQRAAAFARAHGDALGSARAAALCGGPTDPALALLPEPGPRDAAAWGRALELCAELRALRGELAERSCAALAGLQAGDGGFGDPGLPVEERLVLTGAVAGGLARCPFVRAASLDAAAGFLAHHFAPERLQGFRHAALAAYAQCFANLPSEASDEILQWCGRELERGFRVGAFDALRTARVLVLCDAHALPGARLDREELLAGLVAEQAGDGSFGAAAPPAQRVEVTLQGLRALVFLDPASAGRERLAC